MAPRRPPTRWQKFRRWLRSERGKAFTHQSPALLVAGVALYVSYWHIRHVLLEHGYDQVSAAITPLSVDGLVIVAARYITRARTPLAKAFAMAGFGAGVLATLAGNVLAAEPTTVGYAVAVWPAVAVVLTGAVLHWGEAKPKRKRAAQPAGATVPAESRRRVRVARTASA
ncbi:DUF2637 domain-containing protein [Plantactinospora sp. WMMB782]|uniref:DUF2637 domain-containing protein n=1 Tax=Plantactinospora sp. WMMB782 TaxID=3404121 RepID=UPI003B92CE86